MLLSAGLWFGRQQHREMEPGDSSPAEMVMPIARHVLDKVAALGRIEPRNGVIRVRGPPRPAVVIQELTVEEGSRVRKHQVIAILLGIEVQRAEVSRLKAEMAYAEWDLERNRTLFQKKVISESDLRAFELAKAVAAVSLERAHAELALSTARAPIDGQVLEIHTRGGELVDADGIMEIGDTAAMYAVAEVYETDIGRVQVGQDAVVRSPALPQPLAVKVERMRLKIGKKDVLSTEACCPPVYSRP